MLDLDCTFVTGSVFGPRYVWDGLVFILLTCQTLTVILISCENKQV